MTVLFHPILSNKEKIIMDMDGVITSEQGYWTTASLTVYELVYTKSGLNLNNELNKEIDFYSLRAMIMQEDKNIVVLKSRAINTNWDLAYIIFLSVLEQAVRFLAHKNVKLSLKPQKWLSYLGEHLNQFAWQPDWALIRRRLDGLKTTGVEIIEEIVSDIKEYIANIRNDLDRGTGWLWLKTVEIFQEWYLGCDNTIKKCGIVSKEEPLFPLQELRYLLEKLTLNGYKLAIATGRPREEIITPLISWDILKYFDQESIITYSEVKEAEKSSPEPLAKPHPYCFLKAAMPNISDENIVLGNYDKSYLKKCIVIGDASADFLGAKRAEISFLGVMSGKRCLGDFQPLDIFPENTVVFDDIRNLIVK